jgi:dimethylaniline monooxygenase (N-oxide forming)
MHLGIAECRARGEPQRTKMNLMALLFALNAGPELRRALLFGPFAPISFRLQGRDALPDAAHRFTAEAKSSGCVQSSQLQESELQKLRH